ncbi:hypothetical protein JYQ62_04250 [Nostoc sp. UHCC 0702]|nr:hypothetical protein JYQ62_04250 [Nostoc sp. UHCC 0702]
MRGVRGELLYKLFLICLCLKSYPNRIAFTLRRIFQVDTAKLAHKGACLRHESRAIALLNSTIVLL